MLAELGKELARTRQSKGLSLEAVAGPAGISAPYLLKLERGVVGSPSPRVLARVATVLGVAYIRLLELAGYLDELQLVEARMRGSSPRTHPLAGQQLTREEWGAVGDFIKQLIAQRNQIPS